MCLTWARRGIDGKKHYFRGDGRWIDLYNDVAVKVVNKARQYYSNVSYFDCGIAGNTAQIEITRPQGEGAIVMSVGVNLSTGVATCNYDTWSTFYSKMPRTFNIW